MEIKNIIKTLVLVVFLTFFNCKSDKKNEQIKNDYTVSKEIKIDSSKRYSELIKVFKDSKYDMSEDLWSYKDFIYFYENSNDYVNEAIEILENKKSNTTQREVIVYNMQRLSLDNYMKLYKNLYDLYKEKIINKETFLLAIYPTFGKQNTIVKNYKDSLVKASVEELLLDNTLKDYHSNFKQILSGKAWKGIKEYSKY